jgi:Mg2+ and Co2+ transporter CorA
MISHFYRLDPEKDLQTLPIPRAGAWTHVVEPTKEDLQSLVSLFGLDEVIIEDIGDVFEVPRFEQDGTFSYFLHGIPLTFRILISILPRCFLYWGIRFL